MIRRLGVFAKNIDPCQPAQSAQADMGRNFPPSFKFSTWERTSLHHDLTHYHTMPHFDPLKIYIYGKHCEEKEKLLVTSNFSFSHNVFYPIWHFFFHFKCILKCRLQFVSIWTSLKFRRLFIGSIGCFLK